MIGHRILMILQRGTHAKSSRGVDTVTYSDIARIIGVLKPATGNEKLLADKLGKQITDTFVFDKVPGVTVTEGDRIRYGDKVYDIIWAKDVNSRGRRYELSLNYSEQGKA